MLHTIMITIINLKFDSIKNAAKNNKRLLKKKIIHIVKKLIILLKTGERNEL